MSNHISHAVDPDTGATVACVRAVEAVWRQYL